MDSDADSLTDQMIESGILVLDGESVKLADEYKDVRESVARNQKKIDISEIIHILCSSYELKNTDEVEPNEIALNVHAVERFLGELSIDQLLAMSIAIFRIESGIDFECLPSSFIPIQGFEIKPFVNSHDSVIIVFWKEDCDPCEAVMERIQSVVRDLGLTEKFQLAAVYGPPCSEYLYSNFSVKGAPTTLFFEDGSVITRLVGNANRRKFHREIKRSKMP